MKAAVDEQRDAGDVARALGAEERDRRGHLRRRAEATGRHLAAPERLGLLAPPLSEKSRSVAIRPGSTVLSVTPDPATSREIVLNAASVAERWLLESIRLGSGSRTVQEPTLTMRPKPRSRIPGSTSRISASGASTSVR